MAGGVRLLQGLILVLVLHRAELSVFLSASRASGVLERHKRAGSYFLEELFEGNLEKECYEEICVHEEAREVFENDAATDEFWSQYWGGTPCVSQPCLNNGSCHDGIRSYACTCSPGYEGRNCEMAKNECHPERTDGCQHFCHPGQASYTCSCAKGHKLGEDFKSCTLAEKCACGVLTSGGVATPEDSGQSPRSFPWQVKLTNSKGKDFCGGVIIHENFVLTTAKCSLLHSNVSVKTNPDRAGKDALRIGVRSVHVHMRYDEASGENDVSLLELEQPVQCPGLGLPVCTPERDFAEHILIPGTEGLLSGWMLNGTTLGNTPARLPVTHVDAGECGRVLNVTVTTRTCCERGAGTAGRWAEGSVVIRGHKGTWFLTGILGSPPTEGQAHAFLLTKVSRYSMWFKQIMK